MGHKKNGALSAWLQAAIALMSGWLALACASDAPGNPGDSCQNDTDCATVLVCEQGICVHPSSCEIVQCADGQVCVAGHCYEKDCSLRNCPGLGEICVDEACTPGSCLDVHCPENQRCANGHCYPIDCQTQTCPGYGQVCMDAHCVQPACLDVACPPGQACANGYCYPVACQEDCPEDHVCIDDTCQPRSCANVVCQDSLRCVDGWCVAPECEQDGECDDGNACSSDACDPQDGCLHADQPDGLACGLARCDSLRRVQPTCQAGSCTGTKLLENCDDGDPCTQDTCQATGGCGHQTLTNGTACGTGDWLCCAAACIDTASDPAHCGGCFKACKLDNVLNHACLSATCVVGVCQTGWDDCDGIDANGCEQPLTSTLHCGACRNTCGDHETCDGTACRCAGGPGCPVGQYCYPGTAPDYLDAGCYDLPTYVRDPDCSDMGVVHLEPDFLGRTTITGRPGAWAHKYGLHISCLSQGAVMFELPDSPFLIGPDGIYQKAGYLDNPVACDPPHVDLGRWETWVVVDGHETSHNTESIYFNSTCPGSGFESCSLGRAYCPPDFHNGK